MQISKKLNYPIKSLTITRDNDKPMVIDEASRLGSIPYFVDGALIKVQTSQPLKANHSGLTTADLEYTVA